jgi:hypothetical protein
LCARRITLDVSLRRAAPLVVQSVAAVLQGAPDDDLAPALTCLAAWLPAKLLPDAELAALVPLLIALLNSQNPSNNDAHTERTQKIGAALSDLLARPPASWGPAVLLEPLLLWAYATFPAFSAPDVTVPDYALRLPHGANAQLATHARLLVALADAGVEWVAGHLVDASAVQHPNPGGVVPRAVLAQTLVRLMLALSAQDPGGARLSASYYAEGASPAHGEHADDDADDDDDDGEQQGPGPLGFWYLLQEALWEIPVRVWFCFSYLGGARCVRFWRRDAVPGRPRRAGLGWWTFFLYFFLSPRPAGVRTRMRLPARRPPLLSFFVLVSVFFLSLSVLRPEDEDRDEAGMTRLASGVWRGGAGPGTGTGADPDVLL